MNDLPGYEFATSKGWMLMNHSGDHTWANYNKEGINMECSTTKYDPQMELSFIWKLLTIKTGKLSMREEALVRFEKQIREVHSLLGYP